MSRSSARRAFHPAGLSMCGLVLPVMMPDVMRNKSSTSISGSRAAGVVGRAVGDRSPLRGVDHRHHDRPDCLIVDRDAGVRDLVGVDRGVVNVAVRPVPAEEAPELDPGSGVVPSPESRGQIGILTGDLASRADSGQHILYEALDAGGSAQFRLCDGANALLPCQFAILFQSASRKKDTSYEKRCFDNTLRLAHGHPLIQSGTV